MRARVAATLLAALGIALCIALTSIGEPSPERHSVAKVSSQVAASQRRTDSTQSTEVRGPRVEWASIVSEDLHELVGNLRSIGCPETTLRDIAISRVDALFAEREELCRFEPKDAREPWGSQVPLTAAELERVNRWRALQVEKRELLRDLVGLEMPLDLLRSKHSRNYDDVVEALAAMAPEKRDRVQALKESYWRSSDALKESSTLGTREEYVEAYRSLNATHREDLARVLSPQELEDFEMRTSVTGRNLATDLAEFRPRESEARAIFRSLRLYEEASGRVGGQYGMAATNDETVKAARLELQDALRSALGEARFAEYKHSGDRAYKDLVRVAERHGISRGLALEAHALEKAYEEEQRRLKEDLTLEEREQRLRELGEEIEKHRTALLGADAAGTYRRLLSRR